MVAMSWPASPDARMVTNVASCLEQSEIFGDKSRSEIRTVIQKLEQATGRVTSWSPFDESIAKGICAVCRVIFKLNVSKRVVAILRDTIKTLPLAAEVTDINQRRLAGLSNL